MRPILLMPPATEPVTLAETKLYLRIDASDEDQTIASLIRAARLLIEAASGRLLIHQTWRLVLHEWPPGGSMRLPLAPVTEVVAARVFNLEGVATAVPVGALVLERAADPPMLRIEATVPAPQRENSGIEIDVLAGFGAGPTAVPEPLRQAILMMVVRWFQRRGDVASGADARLPVDIAALIASYRRARI